MIVRPDHLTIRPNPGPADDAPEAALTLETRAGERLAKSAIVRAGPLGETNMLLRAIGIGLAAGLLLSTPGHAITAKEKMVTCKFGADDQKLSGKARSTFMTRCMAKADAPAPRAKPAPAPKPQ